MSEQRLDLSYVVSFADQSGSVVVSPAVKAEIFNLSPFANLLLPLSRPGVIEGLMILAVTQKDTLSPQISPPQGFEEVPQIS